MMLFVSCNDGPGLNDIAEGVAFSPPICETYKNHYSITEFIGRGTESSPYTICLPEQLSLIGNTDVNSDYGLDKHYRLGINIELPDEATPISIGTVCEGNNPFTGSFDGRGHTISNIGFTSATKDIVVRNLFACSDGVQNTNFSHITDRTICSQLSGLGTLFTREDSSTGTYVVCNRNDLEAIDNSAPGLLTDSYAMYQNINLGVTVFTPIGTPGNPSDPISVFTGTFDGRGNQIQNLRIDVMTGNAGLFLELGSGGVIQNLSIEEIDIRTDPTMTMNIVSALVVMSSGSIHNCDVKDSDPDTDLTGGSMDMGDIGGIGGLVGRQNPGSEITDSYVENIMITGGSGGDLIGGLVAAQFGGGTIANSYTQQITVNGGSGNDSIGGLLGQQLGGGTIANSYTLSITVNGDNGIDSIGGLAGQQNNVGGAITNSYAREITANGGGDLSGVMQRDMIGGLVGSQAMGSEIANSYALEVSGTGGGALDAIGGLVGGQAGGGMITNSYAGEVELSGRAGGDTLGGLVGFQDAGTIINSYTQNITANGETGADEIGGLVGQQDNSGIIISSYASDFTGNGGNQNDNIGGLTGLQANGTIAVSYAVVNNIDGAGGANAAGRLVGAQGVSCANCIILQSYGFGGTFANPSPPTSMLGDHPAGTDMNTANSLATSGPTAAGSEWTHDNSPWDLNSATQLPVLKFITGAVYNPGSPATASYQCINPPAMAFLPAVDITCGITPLPDQ